MSEAKFTPGPWSLDREHSPDDSYGHWYHRITAGHGYSENGFRLSGIVNPHDAHLIAAAPDMYEVLSEAMERGGVIQMGLYGKALAALAKARGETL